MKLKQKPFLAIPASLVFLFAFLSLSSELAPSNSSALTSTSQITVNIPSSVAITLSKSALNITAQASGSWSNMNTDSTTINVSTSNPTGYSLVLSDEDNDTNLTRIKSSQQESDVTIPTINTTNNPSYNTTTGLPANDVRSNVWGYAVGVEDTSTTPSTIIPGNFFAIPSLSSPRNLKVTDTTSANDNTTVYIGAKLDNNTSAGSYEDVVVLSAIANYTPSASNDITAISPSTISTAGGETLTIDTNIDYADNLVDNEHPLTVTLINTADNTKTVTCGSVALANNSNKLRITCTTGSGLTADANYVIRLVFTKLGDLSYTSSDTILAETPTFWTISYMQQMTPEICAEPYTPSNATGNNVTIITDKNTYKTTVTANNQPYVPQRTLIDVRGKDGTGTMESPATGNNEQTYIVRKLADGNCWMTQNLDMNLSTSTALTNETTDIGYGLDSEGVATGRTSWTPGYDTQASGTTTSWNQNGTDGARSYDNGEIWVTSNNASTTTTKPSDATQAGTYHLGNYYNWNAATAGSGYNGTSLKYTSSNQYAADSICPKGWKLPLGLNETTTNGSFNYLIRNKYGISTTSSDASIIINPMSFIRSGNYSYTGGVGNQGSSGRFWSSTVHNESYYSRHLVFISSFLDPQYAYSKGYGSSIRCLAR